jgi:hypothetical protein
VLFEMYSSNQQPQTFEVDCQMAPLDGAVTRHRRSRSFKSILTHGSSSHFGTLRATGKDFDFETRWCGARFRTEAVAGSLFDRECPALAATAMDGAAILISAGAFTAICLLLAIGANDAADAIATSVGSNALNPNAAVILAAFSQFAGASLAGRRGETPISKAFDSIIGTNGDVDIRGSFLG